MSCRHHGEGECRRVYLLSVSRERTGAPWRATLRAAGTDTRVPFADLEQLALFLLSLPDQCDGAGESDEAADR